MSKSVFSLSSLPVCGVVTFPLLISTKNVNSHVYVNSYYPFPIIGIKGNVKNVLYDVHLSRNARKRTFGHMRPAKIQISLRIRAI